MYDEQETRHDCGKVGPARLDATCVIAIWSGTWLVCRCNVIRRSAACRVASLIFVIDAGKCQCSSTQKLIVGIESEIYMHTSTL